MKKGAYFDKRYSLGNVPPRFTPAVISALAEADTATPFEVPALASELVLTIFGKFESWAVARPKWSSRGTKAAMADDWAGVGFRLGTPKGGLRATVDGATARQERTLETVGRELRW